MIHTGCTYVCSLLTCMHIISAVYMYVYIYIYIYNIYIWYHPQDLPFQQIKQYLQCFLNILYSKKQGTFWWSKIQSTSESISMLKETSWIQWSKIQDPKKNFLNPRFQDSRFKILNAKRLETKHKLLYIYIYACTMLNDQ